MVMASCLKLRVLGLSFVTSRDMFLLEVILLKQACKLSLYGCPGCWETYTISERINLSQITPVSTLCLCSFRLSKTLFLECFSISGKGTSVLSEKLNSGDRALYAGIKTLVS